MELEISSPKTVSSGSSPALPISKKRRNLPGMPDPNAEVIALSPTTLLATNRFLCEICNKGFQRDQNLQLHRRGHNMPWKLKQRTNAEVRKKVYLCPEPSCVHHDPTRALGDLTGIKKHFSRKHGEKKWKCERCSKMYAVQADWKAHMKTCGSREYRCDCGTLFSRRDSFITHRAFCDALAEESSRAQKVVAVNAAPEKKPCSNSIVSSPPPPPPLTPSATILSPIVSTHSPELPENSTVVSQQATVSQQTSVATFSNTIPCTTSATATITTGQSSSTTSNVISSTRVFASIFAPSTTSISHPSQTSPTSFSHHISSVSQSDHQSQNFSIPSSSTAEPTSLCLSSAPSLFLSNNAFSLFPTHDQDQLHFAPLSLQPAMSATALLQKATQMGVTASNASFLRGLGLSMSSQEPERTTTHTQWNNNSGHVKLESNSATALTEFAMGSASLYGTQPTTLDLLGLGLAPTNPPNIGISALFTSFEDELELERNANLSPQNACSVYTETRHNGSSFL